MCQLSLLVRDQSKWSSWPLVQIVTWLSALFISTAIEFSDSATLVCLLPTVLFLSVYYNIRYTVIHLILRYYLGNIFTKYRTIYIFFPLVPNSNTYLITIDTHWVNKGRRKMCCRHAWRRCSNRGHDTPSIMSISM